MPKTILTIPTILTVLAESPRRLAALSDGVPPVRLRTAAGPDEWAANDVLAHLRACADVWTSAIMRILQEDGPTIRAVNPRAWLKRTNYRDLDFRDSLAAYTEQRADLIAMLRGLPPEAWERQATVTGAGASLARTVHEYANRMARHERIHQTQIQTILNTVTGERYTPNAIKPTRKPGGPRSLVGGDHT